LIKAELYLFLFFIPSTYYMRSIARHTLKGKKKKKKKKGKKKKNLNLKPLKKTTT